MDFYQIISFINLQPNIRIQKKTYNNTSTIKNKINIMYAAPTGQQDFTLLNQLHKLNWKQQLTYIDNLIVCVDKYDNPSQIEICLLGMLQEKNINVLNKIFKLIKCYVGVYGISIVSLREFVACVIGFSSTYQVFVEDILLEVIGKSVTSQEQLKDLLKGIQDVTLAETNIESILRITNKLLKTNYEHKVIRSQAFQKILVQSFNGNLFHTNTINIVNISENYATFLKNLIQIYGNNVILLGRKYSFSTNYITYIKQLLKTELKNQLHQLQPQSEAQINYTYDITSYQWLEDYKFISVKCICLSLKEAVLHLKSRSSELDLNQKFLNCLLWLSQKKNKNINKYFFDLISSSLSRSNISQNNQLLLQILFQSISNKKLTKKLLQQQISAKQQLWLNLTSEQFLKSKIRDCTSQEEYHRIIIYLEIVKTRLFMDVRSLCEELLAKENLSLVYRVQVEHLGKI